MGAELSSSWGAERGPPEKPSQSKGHAHSAKGHAHSAKGVCFSWNTAVTSDRASPGLEPQAEIPQQSLLATV